MSARPPRPHSDSVPVPVWHQVDPVPEAADEVQLSHETTPDSEVVEDARERTFDQHELNDLVRDLRLSKELSELLASRLNEKSLLGTGKSSKLHLSTQRHESLWLLSVDERT